MCVDFSVLEKKNGQLEKDDDYIPCNLSFVLLIFKEVEESAKSETSLTSTIGFLLDEAV